nr:hypothetical protein CFP56_08080 [Quercus suber]
MGVGRPAMGHDDPPVMGFVRESLVGWFSPFWTAGFCGPKGRVAVLPASPSSAPSPKEILQTPQHVLNTAKDSKHDVLSIYAFLWRERTRYLRAIWFDIPSLSLIRMSRRCSYT